MRAFLIAAALAVFVTPAGAQTIAPISYSPEFQTSLEDVYGVREGVYLNQALERYVAAALVRHGAGDADDVRIELSIVSARPNRPTFEQTFDQPGIDPMRSFSIGGAELHGVIRDGSGAVIAEVEHRYYSHDIRESVAGGGAWWDARRAMRRFAEKLADAYAENRAS
jgi:hypothetical protein